MSTTGRDTNNDHVECDRYHRHGLVNQSSVLFSMKEVNGRFTMSVKTDSPSLSARKQIRRPSSITVYKTAASTSTRTMGIIVLFDARILETRRSMFQIRYISSPGHFQGFDIALAGTCLPEHSRLVVRVNTINAMIHFSRSMAKTSPGSEVACEFP